MPRLRLLPEVTVVDSEQTAASVLTYLMNRGGPIAIDTETTGLDVMRDRVLFWSMATEDSRYFLPAKYLGFFDRLFQRRDIVWYYANAKYDMHLLANMGMHLAGEHHDIIVMDAMDDDTRAHGLKEQSKLAYGVNWGDFKDLFIDPVYVSQQLGLERSSFTQFKAMNIGEKLLFVYDENPSIVENYASCDAYFTYLRAKDLEVQLGATPLPTDMAPGFDTLYDYFKIIEVPFTKTLYRIERTGMPIDLDWVQKIDIPMRNGLTAQDSVIKELVGSTFNQRSDDAVADLLFGKKGFNLKPISYTTTGRGSTSEKDLNILLGRVKDRKAFKVIEAILAYRTLNKLHGTYVKNIKDLLGPDGRIHCKLNQAIARTGRLSSSNPNLQNIPIRKDPFKIRGMFCAPTGRVLLGADYPQIQARIVAVCADETKMLEDIRNGFDFHSANAANMYGPYDPRVTYDAIQEARNNKELKDKLGRSLNELELFLLARREGAKTVGFGVLFGEGKYKMAHQLGIEVYEAAELITRFFATYPKVDQLIKDTHTQCHMNEYAHTILGRVRRLHMINNEINQGKVFAERRAGFNHLIQGSEIEIMKLAMLQIDNSKEWNELGGELGMTVHDELLSFAPADTAKDALEVKTKLMADPFNWGPLRFSLPIPITPDRGIGKNWLEVH